MAAPYSTTLSSNGLGEIDVVVPNTDTYVVQCDLDLPLFGASACITEIRVNSSSKYTSPVGTKGIQIPVACNAGDTIKIITSSSNAVDQAINAVRVNVAISQGNL